MMRIRVSAVALLAIEQKPIVATSQPASQMLHQSLLTPDRHPYVFRLGNATSCFTDGPAYGVTVECRLEKQIGLSPQGADCNTHRVTRV